MRDLFGFWGSICDGFVWFFGVLFGPIRPYWPLWAPIGPLLAPSSHTHASPSAAPSLPERPRTGGGRSALLGVVVGWLRRSWRLAGTAAAYWRPIGAYEGQ